MTYAGYKGAMGYVVIIDHNNEETVRDVLDRGFWAGFTLYPNTKMGSERMVEIVREYGSERIFVDSSADWGVSDPLAVPKTARLMLEKGLDRVPEPVAPPSPVYQGKSRFYRPANTQPSFDLH